MKIVTAAVAAFAFTCGTVLAATVTPADLLAHGSTYDGQVVTVTGTTSGIVHKTSKRGNNYTTFDLCSSTSCIHVFEYGNNAVLAGQSVTLTGTFSVEKHLGSAVYHNELDVDD